MKSFLTLLFSLFLISGFQAQNGIVRGRAYNAQTNASIEGAKVQLIEQAKGTLTKVDGTFELTGLKPGVYSFKAVSIGFKELIINEITVTNARAVDLDFAMEELVSNQKEVIVKASPFIRKAESPNSLKTLNATEIERLPGANRDVSRVIAALPGVASRATFRNDIIIRGGSVTSRRPMTSG